MTRAMEVYRFELAYQLRRRSTLLYFLIIVGMCIVLLQTMAGGSRDDGNFNSPFAVLVMGVFGGMLALLFVAAFAGDAATRDADTRIDSLFFTSPVGKRAYLVGRFLGAFSMSALLLLALPGGCLIATWMPWVTPESLGPFRASAYFAPYLVYTLPNAFVATALLFTAAALTRRAMASYGAAAFLFFAALICGKLLGPQLGWSVAELLDPLGYTTVEILLLSLTASQKNTFVIDLDTALLANRLLWLGVATIVLATGYVRFRLAHHGVGGGSPRLKAKMAQEGAIEPAIAVPAARRMFDSSTRLRQLLAVTTQSFRELHTSRVWWIVPIVALLFILTAPQLAELEMGIPGPLTTARLAGFLTGDVSILITILIALSVGELVWRERSARIHPLTDVTPVPVWISFAGKFLGLATMLVAALMIFFVSGLAVQTVIGTDRYDIPLYLEILLGLQLPEYLLTAALAMTVHVLVNQKYVANTLIVLTPIAIGTARRLGVEDSLLLYGDLPEWAYSEISGFGPALEGRLWFTLYFGGWALLFALVTYLFWFRGEERHWGLRIGIARRRLTRGVAIIGAAALAVIAGVGGFIFYSTHILNDFQTSAEIEQYRAEYERRYGRFASLPQPDLAATTLHVDFYPRRGTATIRGSHRLENRGQGMIEAIHVATSGGARETTVSFDRGSQLTMGDDELNYRIYELDRALEPGATLIMNFGVVIETDPFNTQGMPPVVENGSILMHRPGRGDHWLPLVGYQAPRELNDPGVRRKYGLRERHPYPRLGDVAVGNEQRGYEKIELDTIIGTDADQVGVAPGVMHRSWVEKGRRYVHYTSEAPVSNAYTILSADYEVHRSKWIPSDDSRQAVDIEIFHHPSHTANLERMALSVRASLEYNTREFSPYPYRQIRLVEYASEPYLLGMTAHSSLITFAEGFSLMRPADDPRGVDFPFAVVAHEVGHQWWGHQLAPAAVEGAGFLAESLAWYSGMLVVEETFGRDHLQRLLDMMRVTFMAPNQPRDVPLLRAVDQLDAYRIGPFAMYALREAVGVEPVNRALRNLLAKFPPDGPPYPTTLDFYAELRATTPSSAHGLLKDLFEEITFWDLRATGVEVAQDGRAGYRVSLQVEAQKLKGNELGNEQPVPMNDPIEIALYDADGTSIYQARHDLRSGTQTIELIVPRLPARAVIDPDHELLDRNLEDNEVAFEAVQPPGSDGSAE